MVLMVVSVRPMMMIMGAQAADPAAQHAGANQHDEQSGGEVEPRVQLFG
jgi:hypothetical protein